MEHAGSSKSKLASLSISLVAKQNRHFRLLPKVAIPVQEPFCGIVWLIYSLPRSVLLNSSMVSLPVTMRSKSELLT